MRTSSCFALVALTLSGPLARAQTCTPVRLAIAAPFPASVSPGFPVPLDVRVVDDCGNPAASETVVTASFSDGSPPLRLVSIGAGRFAATFVPRNPGNVFVAITAMSGALRATAVISVTVVGASPSFQLSPVPTDLFAPIGEETTAVVNLVASDGSGIPFTVTQAIVAGRLGILTVTPESGVTPAELTLRFAPTPDLSPNTSYQAILRIGNFVTTPFTVSTLPPRTPKLSIDPQALIFAAARRDGTQTRQVQVANGGPGTIDFAASAQTLSGGSWLSIAPRDGVATSSQPVTLTLAVDPSAVPTGTHTGRITILSRATGETREVTVTLAVAGPVQNILLSQTGLSFTAVSGAGTDPSQTFGVLNTGEGAMPWQASASTITGGDWLRVSPATGSSTGGSLQVPLVEVTANGGSLNPGTYYGQVEIRSDGATNSPQAVTVTLTVLPRGSQPPPFIRPTGLIFTGIVGGTTPAPQQLRITNLTAFPLSFGSAGYILEGGPVWFSHSPDREFVRENGNRDIQVRINTSGLGAGVRRGFLSFGFSDDSSRTVNLLLVLAPAGTRFAQGRRTVEGCTPARLAVELTQLGRTFSIPASFPTTIEARVVDNCTAPMVDGSVEATFDNGDSQVNLVSLGDGKWSGTWVPRQRSDRPVTVRLSAETRDKSLRAEVVSSGSIGAGSDVPVLTSDSFVSSASPRVGVLPAPGSLLTIYGARLADRQTVTTTVPLPFDLAGTNVVLGGVRLPLLYADSGQINAQVPYNAPVNVPLSVTVRRGSSPSVPVTVTLSKAEPAVFTMNGAGSGQAHAYYKNAAGELVLAGAANPARPGEVLEVYCTGLGDVSGAPEAGARAPLDRLAPTLDPVSATIGGVAANVIFSGLVPGAVGLYQVNVEVPAGAAAGAEVPLLLTIGNRTSSPVSIGIAAN